RGGRGRPGRRGRRPRHPRGRAPAHLRPLHPAGAPQPAPRRRRRPRPLHRPPAGPQPGRRPAGRRHHRRARSPLRAAPPPGPGRPPGVVESGAGPVDRAVISLLSVLWSVASGVQGLIKSLNMIYDVVYRWGPDRANSRWRWLSIGAVVALVLWLLGSAGFGDSVDNHGKYKPDLRRPGRGDHPAPLALRLRLRGAPRRRGRRRHPGREGPAAVTAPLIAIPTYHLGAGQVGHWKGAYALPEPYVAALRAAGARPGLLAAAAAAEAGGV